MLHETWLAGLIPDSALRCDEVILSVSSIVLFVVLSVFIPLLVYRGG